VVATLDRARAEPGSAYKGQLTALESVTAEGPLRVRVVTRLPTPLLLNRLAALFMVPARSGDLAQQPLGTGPYRFVSREGDDIELAAFAGHWRSKPAIERVWLLVRQGPAVLAGLRDGSIDVARNLSARIASEPGRFSALERPGLTSLYLWLDSRPAARGEPRNPFADARVRQALALGLDRQALLAELGQPGVAMNQLAPAGVVGHIGGWPALPHDPAAARALLRQAGYPAGFDASVAESGAPPPDNVAQALRQALLPLGVRLTVQHTTWPLLVAGWESAELPLFVAGWRFETGEVTGFLRDCIATRNPAHGYSSFNPGFSDPALDSLIAESPGFIGRREGLARQEALMRRAMDALPLLPLFTRHDRYGVAARVRFAPRLDGRLAVDEMAWQPR
jgi:peptide/nickel transport system substrate-binding protein